MTKVVIGVLVALNLMACGHNHYEYFVGQKGDTGSTGERGSPGNDGADGQDGTNGIDGTSVTVVKICPGVTVYPSKFVEVLFCIGGKLYGTYSANGGFSSEMPPGAYFSDGINASCNASVHSNCVVTN